MKKEIICFILRIFLFILFSKEIDLVYCHLNLRHLDEIVLSYSTFIVFIFVISENLVSQSFILFEK